MTQYFEDNKDLKDQKHLITINFQEQHYQLYTNNGLFSKEHFDYGSKLLISNILKKDLKGKVLDLGCGYGAVGIIIAKNAPNTIIDMVDITDIAIKTSRENIKLNKLNNINVFKSDIYKNIEKKYNYIITNPPIRAGKEVIRNFLMNAKDYLEANGELWFVMRKDHGVKTMIKEMEKLYDIKVTEKSKGFYIVCATIKIII